jgi:hypothetical protein
MLESSFWARTIGVTCSVLVILAKKEVALNSCLDLDFSRGWIFVMYLSQNLACRQWKDSCN